MLKKTITYTDFNGKERTEDFYFNLTTAECAKMELSHKGGLVEMVNEIVAAQDGEKIMSVFEKIVLSAYGEKSPDGRRFIKSKELSEAFSQTEAYSQLFVELITDTDAMAAFVNGVIPNTKSSVVGKIDPPTNN